MTGSGAAAPAEGSMRIDKWLWVARFFKTRSLAAAAVSGGKVQVDDVRVKPARRIGPGDRLSIHRGETEWVVDVRGIAAQRRPAKEAVLLYEETPQSIARRAEAAEQRRLRAAARARGLGRPTKKERRDIDRQRERAAHADDAGDA